MKRHQDGMALIVSLALLAGALMVTVGGMQTAQLEESATGSHRASTSALMAAESGVTARIAQLQSDGSMPADFSDCSTSPVFDDFQSVTNSQDATVGYRAETCRAGLDAIRVTARGEAGAVTRTVQAIYTIADSAFLGLSAMNFLGAISSFEAPNSGAMIVEGAVDDKVDGGQRPAIATSSTSDRDTVYSAVEAAGTLENYGGGFADSISESILQDPELFDRFLEDLTAYATTSPQGQVIAPSEVKEADMTDRITVVTGDMTLKGNASGSGILIVEGDYGTSGTPQFDGLVIVLGTVFGISGGGHGGLNGALIMSPMTETTDADGNTQTMYANLDVVTSGGGNAAYSYDAGALTAAFNLMPPSLRQQWLDNNVSDYGATDIASWRELW